MNPHFWSKATMRTKLNEPDKILMECRNTTNYYLNFHEATTKSLSQSFPCIESK